MEINLLIDPPKDVRPAGAIRADVAWKLFLPDSMGDITGAPNFELESLKRWLWGELSTRLGFLKPGLSDPVYIITPELAEPGLEFILRTCSFWSNEVYSVRKSSQGFDLGKRSENLWIAPVLNVGEVPGKSLALNASAAKSSDRFHLLLSPLLGSTRSNIRIYRIPPNETFARFHSHSAVEELYLVLNGKGSARIADHRVEIKQGDLISKPTGPDLPTQLLADKNEPMTILDIEIWPDSGKNSKDLMHYQDHGELVLTGEGWEMMLPSEALNGTQEPFANYNSGYIRHLDGSWEPKDIPGFRKREK